MNTTLHFKSKNVRKVKGRRAGRSSPTASVATTSSRTSKTNPATTGAGHKTTKVIGPKKDRHSTQTKAAPGRLTGISPDHRDDKNDSANEHVRGQGYRESCISREQLDNRNVSKKDVFTDHESDDESKSTVLSANSKRVKLVPTSESFTLQDDQSDLTDCGSFGSANSPVPLDDAPANADKSRRNECSTTNKSDNVSSDGNLQVDTRKLDVTAYQTRTLNSSAVLGKNLLFLHSLAIKPVEQAKAELDSARESVIEIGKVIEREISRLGTAIEKDTSELVDSSQEDAGQVDEDKLHDKDDDNSDAKTSEEAFETKDEKVEDVNEIHRTEVDCLPAAKGTGTSANIRPGEASDENEANDPLSKDDVSRSRTNGIAVLFRKTDNTTDPSVDPQANEPNAEVLTRNKDNSSNPSRPLNLSRPSNRRKKSRSTYKIDRRLRKIMPNFLVYGIEISEEGITGGVTVYCENQLLSACPGLNIKKGADRLCLTPIHHTRIDEMVGLQPRRAVTMDRFGQAKAKAEAKAKAIVAAVGNIINDASTRASQSAIVAAVGNDNNEKEDTESVVSQETNDEKDFDCGRLAVSCFCFDEERYIELFECEWNEECHEGMTDDDVSVVEEDAGPIDRIALKAFKEMKSIIKELDDDDSSFTSSTCSSIEMDAWFDVIHATNHSIDEVEIELAVIERDLGMDDSAAEDFIGDHEGKDVVRVVYDSETDDEYYY